MGESSWRPFSVVNGIVHVPGSIACPATGTDAVRMTAGGSWGSGVTRGRSSPPGRTHSRRATSKTPPWGAGCAEGARARAWLGGAGRESRSNDHLAQGSPHWVSERSSPVVKEQEDVRARIRVRAHSVLRRRRRLMTGRSRCRLESRVLRARVGEGDRQRVASLARLLFRQAPPSPDHHRREGNAGDRGRCRRGGG